MRHIGAGLAAVALVAPAAQPASRKAPARISPPKRRPRSRAVFVLKVNGELVLTNVVARDAKTGDVVQAFKHATSPSLRTASSSRFLPSTLRASTRPRR